MKSWKITAPEKIELAADDSEKLNAGQVKIKIDYCDLSRSDLALFAGKILSDYPRTIGKIAVGMVTEVGEGVENFVRGDRVVTTPQCYCNGCTSCLAGRFHACENVKLRGVTCDGFMRDFVVLDKAEILKLPDRIKDVDAIYLDCLSTAISALSSLQVTKGEHVVISDATVLGQIIAQVALYNQAVPIIVDINENFLKRASESGIYYAINSVETDPIKKIFNITGGKMAECVVLINGANAVLPQAMGLAGKGGRVAIVDRYGARQDMTCNMRSVIDNGLTVHGVSALHKNMPMAINMLANKAIDPTGLSDGEVSFEDVGKIIESCQTNVNKYQKYIVKI